MSTNLNKSSLFTLLRYGREALTNRYKDLLLITFLFLMLPQLVAFFSWEIAAGNAVTSMESHMGLSPMSLVEAIIEGVSANVFLPTIIATLLGAIGVLALARTSVDYFESRPATFKEIFTRSFRIFVTKGIGVFCMF